MASAQQRLDQMDQVVLVMQQTIGDLTRQLIDVQAREADLRIEAKKAWDKQEAEAVNMETEIDDLKDKISNGQKDKRDPGSFWHLDHKGGLQNFDGDKSKYRAWAVKLKAFANSKQSGFRKALVWAEKMKEPITDADLQATSWEPVMLANSRLFDLLVGITSGDAQTKMHTTKGEEQGFEAWRRIKQMADPAGALNELDRLNGLTQVPKCATMKGVMKQLETWEHNWVKYEEETGESLNTKLKTGVLLNMLPSKECREVKLRYVDRPSELSYDVLRRHIENWLESFTEEKVIDKNGHAPMDLSTLNIGKLNETQLEQALDVLRKAKGKGKEKGKGK